MRQAASDILVLNVILYFNFFEVTLLLFVMPVFSSYT